MSWTWIGTISGRAGGLSVFIGLQGKEYIMETGRSGEIGIFCESVNKFMHKQVVPVIGLLDHYPATPAPGGFFDDLLSHLGTLGLLDLPPASVADASGEEMAILAAVSETAAEIYASVPVLVLAHAFARHILLHHGTEQQRQRWLRRDPDRNRPPLLAAPLYVEPDGCGLQMEGRRQADGSLVLNGSCELVVNAPLADGLLLPIAEQKGMGVVIVPSDLQGLEMSPPVLTLGLRGSPVSDVRLNEALVPENSRLHGDRVWMEACNRFAGPVAALCAGICRGSLREAVAYAAQRRQGGRRLEEYSQIRMMIASMGVRLETARSAERVISRLGGINTTETLAHLVEARSAASLATQDGVQLLGGYGYMEEYGQERRMRDARQVHALFGRDDRRRMELAEESRRLIK